MISEMMCHTDNRVNFSLNTFDLNSLLCSLVNDSVEVMKNCKILGDLIDKHPV